jgi:hypothetical protein
MSALNTGHCLFPFQKRGYSNGLEGKNLIKGRICGAPSLMAEDNEPAK